MSDKKLTTLASLDYKGMDKLAKWLETSGMEEVEIEQDDLRIRLRRPGSGTVAYAAAPQAVAAAPAAAAAPVAEAAPQNTFNSPMVGTYYHASSPESAPFVKVGDAVQKGQTLAIIEAMKTMNPIESDRAGTIQKILVNNAQPVEYGQPMFVIA